MTIRFLKFCCVGALGFGVNLAVFTLLSENVHYLIAATIAFLVAVSNNYFWNVIWTFKDRIQKDRKKYNRYIKFLSISSLCLIGNLIILSIFIENFKMVQWQAQAVAVFCMSVLNFLLQNIITFEKEKDDKVVSSL